MLRAVTMSTRGERPDPEALLAEANAEDARSRRGRLKIFFGAAPGVGKTYAMLEAARKESCTSADVLVGYIEPHARPETQALVLGLDVLARKRVEYKGKSLTEFDLEAALARRPGLIIVDELAHTNAPGATHEKRWQDVDQLLREGIDVYTTLNVQHLESVNDIVARITGVIVRETVPDAIFDAAAEVELVDLPPDELLERLREGKVYVPDQASLALEHFFQKGNLLALRELALRKMADRVNREVESFRRRHAVSATWPTSDRVLVCVSPSPLSSRLVRAAFRMAASLRASWIAAHVERPSGPPPPDADQRRLLENLRLAEKLGAKTVTLSGTDLVEEVLQYARRNNVTKIIVGKPLQPRWREFFSGSFVYRLTRECGDIDVYVISGEAEEPQHPAPPRMRLPGRPSRYAWAAAIVLTCSLLGLLVERHLEAVNIAMFYLLGVLVVSLRQGLGPSILASILSVGVFDVVFVPPRGTFAVADTQYLITFGVMLVTGVTISTLTARVKSQTEQARQREQRAAALYSLSRRLASLQSTEEILVALAQEASAAFDVDVAVWVRQEGGALALRGDLPSSFAPSDRDGGIARWVADHGERAGLGTATLMEAQSSFLPMSASGKVLAVIGVRPRQARRLFDPEEMHRLETFATQAAAAMERTSLAADASRVKLEVDAERMRNSLLSAVSHDLRTPLSAIAGAGSTLLERGEKLDDATRRELLETIFDQAESMNHLIGNLLDATRLEAGTVAIQWEWQSLEELIGALSNRLQKSLEKHVFRVDVPSEFPLVRGDGLLIQQVLQNLIENAARYSPAGTTIEVSVSLADGEALVQIADRGPGIVAGEEEKIFEKFQRGSSTRGPAGTGLGLFIARGIVELHGGRIWAQNRPDGGAAFSFTLPMREEPPHIAAEETE